MRKMVLPLALVALLLWGCGVPETSVVPAIPVETNEVAAGELISAAEPELAPAEPEAERFLLTFVGDCTLGNTEMMNYTTQGFIQVVGQDYGYPFRNVADYLINDEFTMVNLEGVLGEAGYRVEKTFNFRGPADYVNILTENSVEAVTLANNHSMDYGPAGYAQTCQILQEAGMPYVEKNTFTLVTTKNGLKIGLYAALFAVDTESLREAAATLREAGADVVVLAIHWGQENCYNPSTFLQDMAHDAIDAGADIVYGHHPHVLQRIEAYHGGVIFYSLGNFAFGGNSAPLDFDTALVQQEVIREPDGSIALGGLTVVPCSISSESGINNYQPTPYTPGSEEYLRTMKKLGLPAAEPDAENPE